MAQEMYLKNGSLNPFWVDEDIDRHAKKEFEEYASYLSKCFRNSLKSAIDECRDDINALAEEYDDDEDDDDEEEETDIGAELEAKFQFIKRHSNDPDDLELAKKILGID